MWLICTLANCFACRRTHTNFPPPPPDKQKQIKVLWCVMVTVCVFVICELCVECGKLKFLMWRIRVVSKLNEYKISKAGAGRGETTFFLQNYIVDRVLLSEFRALTFHTLFVVLRPQCTKTFLLTQTNTFVALDKYRSHSIYNEHLIRMSISNIT